MKKGRLSYSSREALRGILFIAPWLIGFVFLFLRPFISAVIYSFNDVDLSSGEVVTFSGASAIMLTPLPTTPNLLCI